ncbi:MAG: hypothetical protein A2140_05820 [Candidatus Muproteobacteria bacterium RBG_16_62_13]|uniref:Uncharacterized protein n=1 Tax=Candidatus Muproteobacteria bacterium RBG_16_62_13 TaxID=1817756 RepID=A0A1F6T7X9_9PROT|nr:MAG: hypothetical protein A2140_05820 [Candidatus Muproteobacteria bacterium RBG_16_62_13]
MNVKPVSALAADADTRQNSVKCATGQEPAQPDEKVRRESDRIAQFRPACLQSVDDFIEHRFRRQGEGQGLLAAETFFHLLVVFAMRAAGFIDVPPVGLEGVGAEAAVPR